MELNALQTALREAQAGLAEIAADFEMLRTQKEKLERLIESLREVLESGAPIGSGALALAHIPADPILFAPNRKETPMWELAQTILSATGSPMTVPEIFTKLQGLGVSTSPESIRVAMFRKPQIFLRRAHGTYGLQGWKIAEEEKEANPEERAS